MKKLSVSVFLFFFVFSAYSQNEQVNAEPVAEEKQESTQDESGPVSPQTDDEVKKLTDKLNELLEKSAKRDAETDRQKLEIEQLRNELNTLKSENETKKSEEAKEEKKKEKVLEFKPYGFFELYGYGNDVQFMSNDVAVYVLDDSKSTGNISARNTRLGLDITVPYIQSVDMMARLEIDFFGSIPDSGVSDQSVGLRMRHGFFKLAKTFESKTTMSLVAGQTWTTAIIPTFPNVINPAAGWGAGNLWNRLPLVELGLSQKAGPVDIGLKAAVVKPISGTNANRKGFVELNIDAGDASLWPSLQGQLFVKANFAGIDLLWAAGGAYGRENYTKGVKIGSASEPTFGDEVEVWMFNTALKICHKYAEVQGKYFMGANMDMFGFFGGSLIEDDDGYVIDSMKGMGYFAELSLKPYKGLRFSVGLGGEYTNHDQAEYDQNDAVWVSAFWTFFDHFTPGFQWQQIITEKDEKKLTGNSFMGSLRFSF